MKSFYTFAWLVWVVAILAALTYCVADDQRVGLAILVIVGGGAAATMIRRDGLRHMPRIAINLLLIAALGNVILRVFEAGATPNVTDMTDFLIYIMLIKLFDRGRPRDEAQLLGLSVFIVIGSVLTGQSLGLGALLMVFTPLALISAVSYQVYQGAKRAADQRAELLATPGAPSANSSILAEALIDSRRGRRDLLATLAVAIVLLSIMSVAGFILTPRTVADQVVGAFGMSRSGGETEFRDRIDLGQGGTIATSGEPVLDLVVKDEQGRTIAGGASGQSDPIYLRGAVLDTYDPETGRWGNSRPITDRPPEMVVTQGGESALIGGAEPGAQRVVQEIQVRYARENASPLFAAWRPWTVKSDDSRVIVHPTDLTLHRPAGHQGRYSYTVVSAPGATRELTETVLPPLAVTPRVQGLATELAQRAGVSADPAAREPGDTRRLINSVIAYFRANFTYDLTSEGVPATRDPIEFFLFDSQRGHCEYFAGATVSILRHLGVPARIVTGYAASEYNPIAGAYVVRKSDAHAWVEAKVRPDRWETFDPTPPGELSAARRGTGGFMARLRQIYEAIEFGWINNVVAFQSSRKVDLVEAAASGRQRFAAVRDAMAKLGDSVSRLIPGLGRWPAAITAILIVIALATAVFAGGRRAFGRWLAGRGSTRGARADLGHSAEAQAYRRGLRLLAKAGLAKPASRPPVLHARELKRRGTVKPEAAAAFESLADRFYRARFGADTPAAQPSTDAALLATLSAGLSALTPRFQRLE